MLVVHLSLTNFRNFVRLETDLPEGPTLLVGSNAQGKTSFLEAVYYLSGARSPHAQFDRQLINFLALLEAVPFARIRADVKEADHLSHIEIRLSLQPNGPESEARTKKDILINAIRRHSADLARWVLAVIFLPQDMLLIEGPPAERRRQLDAVLCQAEAPYAMALAEYGKVLHQRNALLRQLQERGGDRDQLNFWDERLADLAATLVRSRAIAIAELQQLAGPIFTDLTRGREILRLDYVPSYDPISRPEGQLGLDLRTPLDWSGLSRSVICEGMLAALRRSRPEEIARGMTLTGPHRDDFVPHGNGLDLRLYGSRGQNRTVVLALKLAEVEWLHQRTGQWPILLLDEVLAELDTEHRESLLQRVQRVPQAILTAADLAMFSASFRQGATIWKISAGTLGSLTD